MKQQQKQIDQFLLQFSKTEAIPFSVREDFFLRLKEKNGVAFSDVEEAHRLWEQYADANEKRIAYLQKKWTMVANGWRLEHNSEYSLKERIVRFSKRVMTETVERFKRFYQRSQKLAIKKAETAEDLENAVKVARLKSAL